MRVALYCAALLVIVLYGAIRWRSVKHAVEDGLVENIRGSLQFTARTFDAWASSRQAEATLISRLLEQTAEPGDGAVLRSRYARILETLLQQGSYRAAWILDSADRVVAAAGAVETPSRASVQPQPTTMISGRAVSLDFAARGPSMTVVLRAAPTERRFPAFNPTVNSRSGRTTLFAVQSDSAYVVTTSTKGDRVLSSSVFSRVSAADPVRHAFSSVPVSGVAIGDNGTRVAYATAPLAVPGWHLLREQDVSEVLQAVRPPFALEMGIVGTLFLLAAALADYVWRASRLRQAHQLTGMRAAFVSSVSHELRTPLAQIRMYGELMLKGAMRSPEDTRKALDVIVKEAHRLNILVDNVLNFTRLRHRAPELGPAFTLVENDITHIVAAFSPLARERAVQIETHVEPGLVAAVDSMALRQTLLNLLENAVKYGPVGQTVHVEARTYGPYTRITVDDHGPGVASEERERIWHAFVRGSAAAAGTASGSGIGLAVVRDLVLQHGGTAIVTTNDWGGARFVVQFPSSVAQHRAHAPRDG